MTDQLTGRRRNKVPLIRRLGQATVDVLAWLAAITANFVVFWHHTGERSTNLERTLTVAIVVVVHLAVGFGLGLYQGRFWYGSSRELARLYASATSAAVAGAVLAVAFGQRAIGAETVLLSAPLMLLIGQVCRIVHWRRRRRQSRQSGPRSRRMIVFGAGEGGEMALRTLFKPTNTKFEPVALLDDDPARRRLDIEHVRVMGDRDDIARVARATEADAMLIAIPSASSDTLLELTERGRAAGLEVFVLPAVEELFGAVAADDIRPVSESDLLGRHPVEIDIDAIAAFLTGQRVLVTGAGGTIGSELCRQIERFAPASLHMLDCDDSGLHGVELSMEGRALLQDERLLLADIRDRQRMSDIMHRIRPDVVFHAAALKHLSLLERYPDEAWKTNVQGTQNLLDAALDAGVEHFVNISTDKAADPISVLGWSKRITERQTAHAAASSGRRYVSVRFGNVLGSRGSVLEIFEAQLAGGGPLTVTDEEVTRFFMTVAEAVRLTMNAAAEGRGGEVLVLDMGKPVRIADVARRLALSSPRRVDIQFTGLRPGEKMHEVLLAHDEVARKAKHPKIDHVDVPPLDVMSLPSLPNPRFVTVDELIAVATKPASVVSPNR